MSVNGDSLSSASCHICGTLALTLVPAFEGLHQVTSDCKVWPPGGRLATCDRCGVIQKAFDEAWHRTAQTIYGQYTLYHQSRGTSEQAVFDGVTGASSVRSAHLLRQLSARGSLPSTGRLLDVGCGNGALLRAASQLLPGWQMAGVELDDRYKDVVENIAAVEALYTCPPDRVPGTFELITMSHALEHIASPIEFLRSLVPKLDPLGLLVVEVPDVAQNPFDLLVADHASHFTLSSLQQTLAAAGYAIVSAGDTWVPKELTVLARPGDATDVEWQSGATGEMARRGVAWLHRTLVDAERSAARAPSGSFGVFGTSIAGTWLGGRLSSAIGFYVDEDDSRVGRQFMNRPVVSPGELRADAHVFVGLAPAIARSVAARLRRRVPGLQVYEPPPLD